MALNILNTFRDIASDERFIQDIREAVKSSIFYEDTSKFFTIVPGIKGGQQVAAVRDIEYITRKSQGCGGEALSPKFPAISQKWEPQLAEIKIKYCHTEFMQKFTQWGLANGYNIKNLEEADFFVFIQDLVTKAMKLDMQRLVLIGDEDIATQNVLSDSNKAEFYDVIKKGLIPTLQYFRTVGALADNFVDLSLNASNNPVVSDKGYALELMDTVTDTLDFDGDLLLTNGTLHRNYRNSLVNLSDHLESSKTEVQNGKDNLKFDGNLVVPVKNYDRWRKADFKTSNGTYMPHFMLFTKKEFLQVGVDDAAALENLTMEYIGGDDEHFYIKGDYMLDFKMVNPFEFKAAL